MLPLSPGLFTVRNPFMIRRSLFASAFALFAMLACLCLPAGFHASAQDKKDDPAKQETKKDDTDKKDAPKKDEPKKEEKKDAAKKDVAKKDEPKKLEYKEEPKKEPFVPDVPLKELKG